MASTVPSSFATLRPVILTFLPTVSLGSSYHRTIPSVSARTSQSKSRAAPVTLQAKLRSTSWVLTGPPPSSLTLNISVSDAISSGSAPVVTAPTAELIPRQAPYSVGPGPMGSAAGRQQ
jgi:hypothetical protein